MPDLEVDLAELQVAAKGLAEAGDLVMGACAGAGMVDITDIPAPASVIPRSDGKGNYTSPKLEAPDNAFGRELGFANVARAYDEYRLMLEGQLRTLGEHTLGLSEALNQVAGLYGAADQWRG
ncbi:hypothetical protein [Amycolatopsis alba]|uniref:PE domain-containing protein n=1 Tax=Amycolatopsis alba DSM 44262 TaxID=1125972 RepID=A0A229RF75_AMYAL|nr:hypothetical protein [Amycolatopsis alba]OXM45323.1 hypothetical protein CFP75_30655 [Amycolatopsis alba DSM 44262]